MAKSLDKNQAAFLQALEAEDPNSEMWIASYGLMGKAKECGADVLAWDSIEGAFAVCKELYRRKLVDKQDGRSTKRDNGYSLNAAGREALEAWRSSEEFDNDESVLR